MDDPASARAAACAVLEQLVDAGYESYFAGGCVRDRLMGRDPLDYDIATSARPEDVQRVFRHARGVGEAFGVMLVRRGGFTIEVATFRTDGVYADGRHPDTVVFSDAEHDASRRDFTINGIFENPLTEEVIDYVGGRRDLEMRVIRAIGDPAARLREDCLRALRAVRFAARFGFAIDGDTAEAIRTHAGTLTGVSRERIGQEVRWMLQDTNRAVAAWELQYLGLDASIFGAPNRLAAPRRLGRLPDDAGYAATLAAWIIDRGHDDRGAVADEWAKRLVLSNPEHRGLRRCLEVVRQLEQEWSRLGVAAQKRLAAGPGFRAGLLVLRADDPQAFVDVQRRVAVLRETGLAPEPLLDGADLIEAGFAPGPQFKRLLDAIYDAQLEGTVTDRSAALALARAIAAADRGRA
ncbi:MAG: CCA tRNA nucleotidyltransferase [Phycisphaerales bacterium]|nr:CCA tRNA nucleotidyltransferase [Phycisphaerae bacterium]NNF42692.1 CCA tRNA nucleotidyltransferase [Phycisphaerales bacterium]NNM26584.1 CCA tRNA nucleotidyltransferase [Phycisphaerales bacterium]